ncbi:MAG: ATP-binding protein [Syntrophobacteraceae bacterium]
MKALSRSGVDKRIIIAVAAFPLVILLAGMALSLRTGQITRELVTQQFSSEQLSVARGAKLYVEQEFNDMRRELLGLARNLSEVSLDSDSLMGAELRLFSHVMEGGVQKIELVDRQRRKKWTYLSSGRPASSTLLDEDSLPAIPAGFFLDNPSWTSAPISRGSEIFVLLVAPIPGNASSTVHFHINATQFFDPYFKNVRSGKTGYAWVIDTNGMFLFHPNPSYVSKSAFSAREETFPGVSYVEINKIQQEQMLKGLEGIGTYTSYWHRGETGVIEKLLAYTPIQVAVYPPRIWSVAVTSPVNEAEEAIASYLFWQFVLVKFIIIVLTVAAGTVIFLEVRWSRSLEKEVQSRTEAFMRSEENYRSLVESAEDFIFTLDGKGILLSVNSFTARFFGSNIDDIVGRSVRDLMDDEVAERMVQRIRTVFETGKSVRYEFELKNEYSSAWINVNLMPLRDETSWVNAVLCIARDITENKKLERQLVSSEKLASLGTLAAGVAHEINNPLGVILGFCDLLIRTKEVGSPEYEDLKIIEQQGFYCKEITENLLSFTRQEDSDDSFANLNECLRETLRIVQHTLEMKGVELNSDFGMSIPPIRGDCRQLQQVFLNLITNAVAAMDGGGNISIVTRPDRKNSRAIIEIKDTGVGISKENLDRIFDPFFTTKPEGEGTGLGLFVSYGIIKKYGGTIECRSQTSGSPDDKCGTTFTIKLATLD